MKTDAGCVVCHVNQMADVGRMVTDDPDLREKILRRALGILENISYEISPPQIARELHLMVRELTGSLDPYAELKRKSNEMALGLYDLMNSLIDRADDGFTAAVRIAAAGNVIDFGLGEFVKDVNLEDVIREEVSKELAVDDIAPLKQDIDNAGTVLILGDNSGEIVCDRVLVQRYISGKAVYAVKAAPILNDSTREDADFTGMSDAARVIDNGIIPPVPGTLTALASEEFMEIFNSADVVISKGQGNYETLSEADRDIYFILKAKCPAVARDIGCAVGDILCMKNQTGKAYP